MALQNYAIPGLLGVLAIVWFLIPRRTSKSSLPLPPGPKKLPFIGNVLDLPTKDDWLTYHEWSLQYSAHILLFSLCEPILTMSDGQILISFIWMQSANQLSFWIHMIASLTFWRRGQISILVGKLSSRHTTPGSPSLIFILSDHTQSWPMICEILSSTFSEIYS